ASRGGGPDWARPRQLWRERESPRLVKELPPPAPQAPPEPAQRLEGKDAIAAWLGAVPAGAPLAVDWAGGSTPPEPRIAGLAAFHPAAGAAELSVDVPPASFRARGPIVHDPKPPIPTLP